MWLIYRYYVFQIKNPIDVLSVEHVLQEITYKTMSQAAAVAKNECWLTCAWGLISFSTIWRVLIKSTLGSPIMNVPAAISLVFTVMSALWCVQRNERMKGFVVLSSCFYFNSMRNDYMECNIFIVHDSAFLSSMFYVIHYKMASKFQSIL